MDPDPSMFLPAALSLLLLCGTVRCLQLLCALERNEEDEVIGYSDTFAGLLIVCAAQVLALVFCVWLLVRPCAWWVAALLAVLSLPVLLVTISFGFAAQHKLTAVEKPLLLLVGKVFTLPAKLLFRALHLSAASPMTEEDILELVDDAEEGDFIDESQKEMISAVFELDDLEAGEIMTHRTELEAMEDTTLAREVIAVALEKGFSRFPVYHKNLDDIVGILHVKDLLNLVKDPAGEAQPIKSYMRSVMFVPESCHARELLLDFKAKHTQIAVVVDEYGGTAGIVTMEDILEEIVGNIQDEFDNEDEEITAVDGGFETEGSTDLDDIFERFGLEAPPQGEDEDFDSVGGMILQRIGRFPAAGEEVRLDYGELSFTVLDSGERRIERVLCRKAEPGQATSTH